MKFIPVRPLTAKSMRPFCTGPHKAAPDAVCGECGHGETVRHMSITGGSRVCLCQRCYEMYAEFIALERIVGA